MGIGFDQLLTLFSHGTAFVIVAALLWFLWHPPTWLTDITRAHIAGRAKIADAEAAARLRIAESIERIETQQLMWAADFRTGIAAIQQTQIKLIELREQDNDRLANMLGRFEETAGACTRAVNICERLQARSEPRKVLLTDEQREQLRGTT